jgi:hypothetical protein
MFAVVDDTTGLILAGFKDYDLAEYYARRLNEPWHIIIPEAPVWIRRTPDHPTYSVRYAD